MRLWLRIEITSPFLILELAAAISEVTVGLVVAILLAMTNTLFADMLLFNSPKRSWASASMLSLTSASIVISLIGYLYSGGLLNGMLGQFKLAFVIIGWTAVFVVGRLLAFLLDKTFPSNNGVTAFARRGGAGSRGSSRRRGSGRG